MICMGGVETYAALRHTHTHTHRFRRMQRSVTQTHTHRFRRTQRSVVDDGGHAGHELGTEVTHRGTDHRLAAIVATVALITLFPGNRGGVASGEHLQGGVAREQGDLEGWTEGESQSIRE